MSTCSANIGTCKCYIPSMIMNDAEHAETETNATKCTLTFNCAYKKVLAIKVIIAKISTCNNKFQ